MGTPARGPVQAVWFVPECWMVGKPGFLGAHGSLPSLRGWEGAPGWPAEPGGQQWDLQVWEGASQESSVAIREAFSPK